MGGLEVEQSSLVAVFYTYSDVITVCQSYAHYSTSLSCMPGFLMSAITSYMQSSERSERENERGRPYNAYIGSNTKSGGDICIDVPFHRSVRDTRQSSSLHCDFAKFWTPHFSFLDSTLLRLDSTFWLDSTLKLNYAHGTRKLCYRKDDRAMRFIHGCPENFRDSLITSTLPFLQNF